MYGTSNIEKQLQGGSDQERHSIMTPIGQPGGQSQNPQDQDDPRPMQYDAIQVDPINPLAHLRNEGGGYLGPAALENVDLGEPTSRGPPPSAAMRPRHLILNNNNGAATNNNVPYKAAGKVNHAQSVAGSLDMDNSSSYQSERNRETCLSCKERTGCEKMLLMSGAILLIIIITLATGMGFLNSQSLLWGPSTCQSQACVKAAGEILESLDVTVEPCENFVHFACGGWYGQHPVPESEFRWSMLDILDETTLYELKHLLEEKPEGEESIQIQSARKVYQACVNDSSWTEVGLSPLFALLDEVGGLPMIESDWKAEGFQLETLLAWARRLGWMPIVSLGVSPDLLNNDNYAVYFSQGQLRLPLGLIHTNETEALKETHTGYMKRTVKEMLKAKGLEDNEEMTKAMEKDVEDIWQFAVELAKISMPDEMLTDPWVAYNPMSIDRLTNLTNKDKIPFKVNWLKFFEMAFNGTNLTIDGNYQIIVEQPLYFFSLTRVLNETSPRTIANFVLFQIIHSMAEETSTTLRDVHASFEETLWTFGRTSLRPWHDCAGKTRILLRLAVAQLYFKKHSLEDVKNIAEKLVSDVAEAFRTMLISANWMSPNATEEALKKLDNMIKMVAYPDYLFDDEAMDKQIKGMPNVSATDHFGNVMALTEWISLRSLKKIEGRPYRNGWVSGPLEINAFYSAVQNALMIPGGVLTPPLFHHEDLPALNYGGIGAIIGHEITHGYDTNGRHFDWKGGLSNGWDNETISLYLERSKCFQEQYANYNVTDLLAPFENVEVDLKIDPITSSGENIADNGGLRAAWMAYKKHVTETGKKEFHLPGLENYSQDQLFFISFSKLWCMQFTPFALQYTVANDRHPPGHFRILGALQNNKEFSETFSCPVGSPMNPEKKCLLW